jgi:hypothetical protein
MRRARVKLTSKQVEKLKDGGTLTIRLADTELKISAESRLYNITDRFEEMLKSIKI